MLVAPRLGKDYFGTRSARCHIQDEGGRKRSKKRREEDHREGGSATAPKETLREGGHPNG